MWKQWEKLHLEFNKNAWFRLNCHKIGLVGQNPKIACHNFFSAMGDSFGRTFKVVRSFSRPKEKKYGKNAHKINEVDKNSSVWIKWIDSEPWQKYWFYDFVLATWFKWGKKDQQFIFVGTMMSKLLGINFAR